jgi:hypothetical protein
VGQHPPIAGDGLVVVCKELKGDQRFRVTSQTLFYPSLLV